MNKIEFQQKLEEGNALIEQGKYEEAVELFDLLNLDSVRDPRLLQNIAKSYEKCHRYEDAEDLLLQARECAPKSRGAVFHLCTLAIKAGNLNDAIKYYNDFCAIAKYDSERFILQYRIAKAEKKSDAELIDILEKFKGEEPDDRWMYELAKLYAANGRVQEALELCDEITLWFYNGKYVKLAKEFRSYLTGEPISEEEPIEDESTVVTFSGDREPKAETLDDGDEEGEGEGENAPEAGSEPEGADAPETVVFTAPQPETETEPETEEEPETEPEEAPETEPEEVPEEEPASVTETEPETAPETEPENETGSEPETAANRIPDVRFEDPVFTPKRPLVPQPESIVFPNQQVFVMDVRTGRLAIDAAMESENELREQERRRLELEETEQKLKSNRSELKKMNADMEFARAEYERLRSEAGGLRATLLALEQAVAEATLRKETTEEAAKATEKRVRELEAEEARRLEALEREAIERAAREEAERIAREEAERIAREEAEQKAREEAERIAREEAEQKAREEAEHVVTLEETPEEPAEEEPQAEEVTTDAPAETVEEEPFVEAPEEVPFEEAPAGIEWTKFEIHAGGQEEKEERSESEIRFTLGDPGTEEVNNEAAAVEIDAAEVEKPEAADTIESVIEIEETPEAKPESEIMIETEPETEQEIEAEITTESEAEKEPETEAETESETEPEPEAEHEPEAEPEPETEAETETEPESERRPDPDKPISEYTEFEIYQTIRDRISERLDHIEVDPMELKDLRHIMVYGTDEEPVLNSSRMLLKRIDEITNANLGKVVKIHASRLKGIPIRDTIDQLIGRKIIVESASLLSNRQLEDFASILRGRKDELMVCFADTLENLVQIADRVPEIPGSFSAIFNGNAPDVKELVNIVKNYLDKKDALLQPDAEEEVRDYVKQFLTEYPFDARAAAGAFAKDALHAAEHSGMFGLFTGKIDDNGFLHVSLKHVKKAEAK